MNEPWAGASSRTTATKSSGSGRNYGAQRELTWNVRLRDGSELHLAQQLEDLGLALPREAWPAVGRVKVVAVPKEGWRRFF